MGRFTAEQLTADFYQWEQRGRGWRVWEYPVELEPPFEPFFHSLSSALPVDDGRKPTWLSSLADAVKDALGPAVHEGGTQIAPDARAGLSPFPFECGSDVGELAIQLPLSETVSPEYAEQFLLTLSACAWPLSFEIVGSGDSISIRIACREPDLGVVKEQIGAYFPQVVVTGGVEPLHALLASAKETVVVDCGLDQEFMRPLRTCKNFDPDPLTAIFGVLENLKHGEAGLVQVLFQAARSPWVSSILRAVRDDDGSSFFLDSPEMPTLANDKVHRPLFSVVLRLVGQGATKDRAWEIVRSLCGGLRGFADPGSNELIPLANDGYDDETHIEDVIRRESHRGGMLLNSAELLGLVHFPSASVNLDKLSRIIRRTRPVPGVARGGSLILGENVHREVETPVSLNTETRLKHTHIIGKTGSGKSTLLTNMIKQDMEGGKGVAVLDPHGDLIDRIIECVPEERIDDVVLFDPGDAEDPVGFNVLQARSEIEKTVLSSDLVEIFRRFATSWGDQMTTVLGNAIAAILEGTAGGTLIELKRILLEKDFRAGVLAHVVDPQVVYFWEKEYPLLRGGSQVSILTRLDQFLRSRIIRAAVTRSDGLDFAEIVNNGKILLVKLSQGIIGAENAHLLGSLICSKLHQVVMGRQSVQVSDRIPFFCFLDEFQHFATPSMASILSSSRKYGFGLVLAHQDLHQISDPTLSNSVLSNPATRICFALGDTDAQKLKSGFAHFEAVDLLNLGVGEAIVRVERSEYDFNLRTHGMPTTPPDVARSRREKIIACTRERYGRAIPPPEFPAPQFERMEIPTTPVETKPVLHVSIKEERAEVRPPHRQTPLTEEFSIPSDDLANRKSVSQHRYLQALTKRMAEQRGYRAIIEEPTPDGKGRVDIGLERDGKKIAVEISVTTNAEQELHNIEKCLGAGYESVVACSPEPKNLAAIRKLTAGALTPEQHAKVRFFGPEGLFLYLDEQIAAESKQEDRVKGYRVKVQYQTVSEAENKQKRDAITQIVAQALRHLKRES
jgi:Type IV secretion-system coupling protein DNA-binding domain/TraM recognition site of TraD and TraG